MKSESICLLKTGGFSWYKAMGQLGFTRGQCIGSCTAQSMRQYKTSFPTEAFMRKLSRGYWILIMASPSDRVPTARSRNGCITCKTRRVKCDETRPTCRRCENAGRRCDGYGDGLDSGSPEGASSNSLRSPDLISEDEYRSLEFFHQNTTQAFTADIGVLLLRVAYHQPILRSIAVALGSLHRSFVLHGRGPLANSTDAQFMLLHYNRAIRELVSIQPETAQRDETFLIACIFFFCFECLRGEYKNAV
ncbi:unnamed protein product [Penicillium nalgiovense]|nr:unnamed protein product [Penicillium nalgiovense]